MDALRQVLDTTECWALAKRYLDASALYAGMNRWIQLASQNLARILGVKLMLTNNEKLKPPEKEQDIRGYKQ
ncbi:hypothetical protein CVT25_004045 [Psilocybe cyanescens]|uniref:Uncharacterized protein n=1 Tax=Psilocybe cyanescens TaxID=93625 RepID=A0A409WXT2_PSICY|nr:hypothetical protein CVT25_004045 [Psilocybe cyanescens]